MSKDKLHKRWTTEDETLLLYYREHKKLPHKTIAAILGRSEKAVGQRYSILKQNEEDPKFTTTPVKLPVVEQEAQEKEIVPEEETVIPSNGLAVFFNGTYLKHRPGTIVKTDDMTIKIESKVETAF